MITDDPNYYLVVIQSKNTNATNGIFTIGGPKSGSFSTFS